MIQIGTIYGNTMPDNEKEHIMHREHANGFISEYEDQNYIHFAGYHDVCRRTLNKHTEWSKYKGFLMH
jgi:hypothetical protein